MIVVKTNKGQRLGNLLYNIGMAYTIQNRLPNHPDIYCTKNKFTETDYFRRILKPIFFKDIKFVKKSEIDLARLKLIIGGQYKLVNPPIEDNVILTWHWQNCIELDLDILRRKYMIPDFEQFCKITYPQVFDAGKETIGINVRRGDFLTFNKGKFFYINDVDFYQEALNQFDSKGKNIFIVSDDIEWCKQNLSNLGENVYFSKETDCINNFKELLMCDYLILGSSSTYSIWASYLNTRKKLVVCPKKLYQVEDLNVHSDIIFPQDYIKI